MMNGEAIGGLIISLFAFGAVIWVIRYLRERNHCPRCRDSSPPETVEKFDHSLVEEDRVEQLFFCPKCHDEWWAGHEKWPDANVCPSCNDDSTPWLMSKEDDKRSKKTTPWGDVVRCKACRHEWRRMPLDTGGGGGVRYF